MTKRRVDNGFRHMESDFPILEGAAVAVAVAVPLQRHTVARMHVASRYMASEGSLPSVVAVEGVAVVVWVSKAAVGVHVFADSDTGLMWQQEVVE